MPRTVWPANISSTKRTVDGGSSAKPRHKSKASSASSVSRPNPPAPTMYVAAMSRRYPAAVLRPWDVEVHRDDQSPCLLYTSDAADDLLCVDLGGSRSIKKKKKKK